MDNCDGEPLRADVSLFRFPTARIYIVCVLASRLLYWVRMFSGFGILIAPRSSTFRVVLGGYFSFHFFMPREEVLINIALILVVSSIAAPLLIFVLFYRMVRESMSPLENPMLGEALSAVAQGTAAIMRSRDHPQH